MANETSEVVSAESLPRFKDDAYMASIAPTSLSLALAVAVKTDRVPHVGLPANRTYVG
jgi:hypothetical protein